MHLTFLEAVGVGLGFLAIVAPDFWPKMPKSVSYILAAIGLAWLSYSLILGIESYSNMKLTHGPLLLVILGTLCIASGLFWHINRLEKRSIPTTQSETKATTPTPTYKTLSQHFENDFPQTSTVIFDSPYNYVTTDPAKAENSIPIRTAIYIDYPARTEFAGYYIPRTKYAVQVITQLPDYLKEKIEEAHQRAPFIFKDPNHKEPDENQLAFSGRVFVYHEDELSPAHTGAIWEAYQKRGLSVQFRGPGYPAEVWRRTGH